MAVRQMGAVHVDKDGTFYGTGEDDASPDDA